MLTTAVIMMGSASFYFVSSHPVMLVILILAQALSISVAIFLHIKISWFSFVLFLIFLGGLMVLFVYITSLASNENININQTSLLPMALSLLLICSTLSIIKYPSLMTSVVIPTSKKCIQSIFSHSPKFMILITMIYLLLTLIIAVKISNLAEAPIKSIM